MERLALALVLAGAAVLVALVLARRQRSDAPLRTGHSVPQQLDRHDFARPEAPWLVAVFTSSTCESCGSVWDKARHLDSAEVATQQLEAVEDRSVHERYRIEAVPTTIVADDRGAVRASFLGPVTATDLWAAVAELREPGSTPGEC